MPVSYDEKLEVNTLTVQISRVTAPALQFVAITPVDLVWISVHKLHRDMLVEETSPIFIGQIKSMSFRGTDVQANCVGFEHYLKQVVPRYRYGPGCQHTLYDSKCGVNINDYSHEVDIGSISSNGLTLTTDDFGDMNDNYLTLGFLEWEDYSRMITDHDADLNTINLRYYIPGLDTGDTVTVSAGCDKTRSTCENKFDNLINQLGFPDIPADNPATWS